MTRVKYCDTWYVKIGGQWYWDTGGDLVPEYNAEKILDGLVSGSDMPTEAERLVVLMEECGEVIQACSKILRHGWKSSNGELIACGMN